MLNLLDKARALPTTSGVYVMRDAAGIEIYVGKAKNLRNRVSSYFRDRVHESKTQALLAHIADFDYAVTASELEAFLLESNLIKDLQPHYNLMLKNNEVYPYLEVTWGEDFPRVLITRRQQNPASRYFGPFVGIGDLRACVQQLQRLFQFRLCKKNFAAAPQTRRGRGCLNYHLQRCRGVCCGMISKDEYRARLSGLCRFLSGQKKDLLADLSQEMATAVKNLHFETAAALRDLIAGLENLNQYPVIDATLTPAAPPPASPQLGLQKLQQVLALDFLPRTLEGVDIANLQGQETVGALVNFVDGQPFKNGYRRFRIKTVDGQNDFACLQEVMRRRCTAENLIASPLPDIMLIDGGSGQLNAVATTLHELGVTPRVLLSLAKKEEVIFRAGGIGADNHAPIILSKRHPALRLLMYVRDEAHRFAQHYHHLLRKKSLFN